MNPMTVDELTDIISKAAIWRARSIYGMAERILHFINRHIAEKPAGAVTPTCEDIDTPYFNRMRNSERSGEVPLPEAKHWICVCRMGPESEWPPSELPSPKSFLGYSQEELITYGDARDAVGRAAGGVEVKARLPDGWYFVRRAGGGFDYGDDVGQPHHASATSPTGRLIAAIANADNAAPLPRPPTAEGVDVSAKLEIAITFEDGEEATIVAHGSDRDMRRLEARLSYWRELEAVNQQMTTQGGEAPTVKEKLTVAEPAGREAAMFVCQAVLDRLKSGEDFVDTVACREQGAGHPHVALYTDPSPVADAEALALAGRLRTYSFADDISMSESDDLKEAARILAGADHA